VDLKEANLESAMSGTVRELRPQSQIGESELRMWLFVRKDLPMPPGKLAAQAGHGFGTCIWIALQKSPDLVGRYMAEAQGKIVVAARNEDELLKAVEACREAGLPAVAVKDAAHTVFSEPTWTVGAVGPCYRHELPKKVSRLRLFTGWENSTAGDAS